MCTPAALRCARLGDRSTIGATKNELQHAIAPARTVRRSMVQQTRQKERSPTTAKLQSVRQSSLGFDERQAGTVATRSPPRPPSSAAPPRERGFSLAPKPVYSTSCKHLRGTGCLLRMTATVPPSSRHLAWRARQEEGVLSTRETEVVRESSKRGAVATRLQQGGVIWRIWLQEGGAHL